MREIEPAGLPQPDDQEGGIHKFTDGRRVSAPTNFNVLSTQPTYRSPTKKGFIRFWHLQAKRTCGGSTMADVSEEHERTAAFAAIAMEQIKALRQAATPRNYEIWYNYATGYQPSLNQHINDILISHGALSA